MNPTTVAKIFEAKPVYRINTYNVDRVGKQSHCA